MIVEEKVKVMPSFVVAYPQFYTDDGLKLRGGNKDIREVSKKHNNTISRQAKRKIEKAINYTVLMSKTKTCYNSVTDSTFKFKISFITLTLSSHQIHSDNYIKEQLLQPFLQQLRQKYKVKYYVWKAERQQNGRIHFHIICDQFVHWKALQYDWNKIQDKLQYITRYWEQKQSSTSFPTTKSELYGVNSTDIHSVKKVRDLGRYLCKYFDKNYSKNRIKIKSSAERSKCKVFKCSESVTKGAKAFLKANNQVGRLWSCSENLSKADGVSESVNLSLSKELQWIKEKHPEMCYEADYCRIITISPFELKRLHLFSLYGLFENYCLQIFNDLPDC